MTSLIFTNSLSLVVIFITGYAIAKKYEAKLSLFIGGIILLSFAVLAGKNFPVTIPSSAGDSEVILYVKKFMSVFLIIKENFFRQFRNIGIIVMTLFGFSAYMDKIGANNVAINFVTKILYKVKSPYLMVPIAFYTGTLLSLVIPSAAALAVILMGTFYPIMRAIGMSSLAAGAVIATTATIMPTPLGGDNIRAAEILNFPTTNEYVFHYHAKISIPIIIIMGIIHYFWQRYMDKRQGSKSYTDAVGVNENRVDLNIPGYYGFFPLLPLVLIILSEFVFTNLKIGLVEVTFFSFLLVFIMDSIHKRSLHNCMNSSAIFFEGMGKGFTQVVVLIVAASTFVDGLKVIGFIDSVSNIAAHSKNAGFALTLLFSIITGFITFISGSGNAAFFSFIEIIPPIAEKASVNPILVVIPMQFASNIIRAVSPVAAVVIVVAGYINVNPVEVVKRTSAPLLVGFILTIILSLLLFS